jgi:hypothetical protein
MVALPCPVFPYYLGCIFSLVSMALSLYYLKVSVEDSMALVLYNLKVSVKECTAFSLYYLKVSVEDSMVWSLGESRPELPVVSTHLNN